jgi:formylmethanofuran dehydrogenase subunit D
MARAETFVLIPGRTSRQGTTLNEGKFTAAYVEETTTLLVSPEDMSRLGLKNGDRVRLRSEQGAIEIACAAAKAGELPPGVLFLPYGDMSSRLMGGDTHGTGMPNSKSFDVELDRLLRGIERAPPAVLDKIGRKGRTIVFAAQGSEELRYLQSMAANANVGGPNLDHIVLREDARKIEALEEFLHGTQQRLGIVARTSLIDAEKHVKRFMVRHRKLLGISAQDVEILNAMLGGL